MKHQHSFWPERSAQEWFVLQFAYLFQVYNRCNQTKHECYFGLCKSEQIFMSRFSRSLTRGNCSFYYSLLWIIKLQWSHFASQRSILDAALNCTQYRFCPCFFHTGSGNFFNKFAEHKDCNRIPNSQNNYTKQLVNYWKWQQVGNENPHEYL